MSQTEKEVLHETDLRLRRFGARRAHAYLFRQVQFEYDVFGKRAPKELVKKLKTLRDMKDKKNKTLREDAV